MMEGLKEWATVVKALEQGKQTVILRKGGILETASGFKIESKKFFLFPTWEHQEIKHVKPESVSNIPPFLRITVWSPFSKALTTVAHSLSVFIIQDL